MKFILTSFFLSLRMLSSFVISFTFIGIILAFNLCFINFDLKKIIAFSSILHLNHCFVCILSMNYAGLLSLIQISISHGFSSFSLFLFSSFIINKTYSRYFDSFFFINTKLRAMLLFFILSNLSFPCSINFVGEIHSLIAIVSIDSCFSFMFLLSSFLST